ncbi:SseB family protein [Crystallibacter degradans]|uniref:SseB family protein n=1 Tax=Crystallibacter degradans TaxID=2726743 RepID=UPI001472A198|nr:SseB family protein [Arthrobacter sp. SF27]NMR29549.1 SseB family protein [Arthrobacter sp. SF27]
MTEQTPIMVRQQELVESLAAWMLSAVNTEPGWDRMVLELKPSAGAILTRITQERQGASGSNTGQLQPGTTAFDDAAELHRLTGGTDGRSWKNAAINVTAHGWPDPRYNLDTYFNYDQPAPDFGLGEPEDAARSNGAGEHPARGAGVDNRLVREAIEEFSRNPGQQAAVNVLRQVIGSELLLDITDAGNGRPGISIVEANGVPAVLAFTSQETLAAFRANTGRPGAPASWVQRGEELLKFVDSRPEVHYLYLDPAGPSCALGRPEIHFAVASMVNPGLKAAAGTQSAAPAVAELSAQGARVLLADNKDQSGQGRGPLVLAGPEGQPVLPVFSSGVEVAAFDSSARFTEVDAAWVLDTIRRNPDRELVINPAGPSVVIRHGDL